MVKMIKLSKAQEDRWDLLMSLLDVAGCPFPPLKVPPFREYRKDKWHLKYSREHPSFVRGYFSGLQPFHDNWILLETGGKGEDRDRVWMSITPMELESQAHHALAAKGRVLIGGGGMGIVAWNCAIKPEVTEVVIVERDPEIVLLCNHIAYAGQWPAWREKVKWVNADMLEYKPDERFDVALIDIWPGLGDMTLRPDMQRIHKNLGAGLYAAWGMELDYVSWCQSKEFPPTIAEERPGVWREYSEAIGVPLIMQDEPKMGQYAMQAAMQYAKGYLESEGNRFLKSISKPEQLAGEGVPE